MNIPIFCLNLERATERKEYIQKKAKPTKLIKPNNNYYNKTMPLTATSTFTKQQINLRTTTIINIIHFYYY
jgi:hypothetical protein